MSPACYLATEIVDILDKSIGYEANLTLVESDMWDALTSALVPDDRDGRWSYAGLYAL